MKGNRKAESLFECFVQMSYSYKRPKPLKVTNYWNFRFCVEFKMLKNRKNTLHWNNLSRQTFCHFTIVSIGIPNKSSIFWKKEKRWFCCDVIDGFGNGHSFGRKIITYSWNFSQLLLQSIHFLSTFILNISNEILSLVFHSFIGWWGLWPCFGPRHQSVNKKQIFSGLFSFLISLAKYQ